MEHPSAEAYRLHKTVGNVFGKPPQERRPRALRRTEIHTMEKTLIERAQALTAGITKPFRSPFMPLWPTPTPPIEVVVDLARAGRGDETIAAALVRGAVYAKSLSVEEVRDALGEQVASIVAECNDPGGPDAWTSHETRMRHLAETLRSGSAAAHAILCVEAIHTLRRTAAAMEQHGVDVWRGQPGGYEGQRSLYRTLLEAAWGRPGRETSTSKALQTAIETLFGQTTPAAADTEAPAAQAPRRTVQIFTDGACSGNLGPGGWAAVIVEDGRETHLTGRESPTTNNRMELRAATEALESLAPGAKVRLTTDSTYVKNGVTRWINGWRCNGWSTANGGKVKNVDLWRRLDAAAAPHDVQWAWVKKGDAGHALNSKADELARGAIYAAR